ncbi:MAG: glycosyltransferase [Anaerolineae bacterium]|nr:glycosyltransferase [Anaerolineae bacterium]
MKRTIERRFTCPVVHVPNFAPDENPQGSLWEPGDYYLFVGVHEAHKGILELASATAIQRSGHSIMFVGLGRYERRLRTMERDSPSKMEIRGWAGPEVLSRLYRRARGLIVPSLAHENSPLAAIEALSWGTPLLVSNRGGLEELIRGGDAGVSFEPDASEIATAIMSFEDSGFPHKLREKARWTYETHHHPRKYLERYMALTEVEGKSYQQEVSQEAARSGLHSHEMASYQGVGPD